MIKKYEGVLQLRYLGIAYDTYYPTPSRYNQPNSGSGTGEESNSSVDDEEVEDLVFTEVEFGHIRSLDMTSMEAKRNHPNSEAQPSDTSKLMKENNQAFKRSFNLQTGDKQMQESGDAAYDDILGSQLPKSEFVAQEENNM